MTHIRDPILRLTFATPFRDSHSRPNFATHVRDSRLRPHSRLSLATPDRASTCNSLFWSRLPSCDPTTDGRTVFTPPEASTPPARTPSNIPTFITPPEPPSIPPVWEHVIDVLMKLPITTAEGQNMRSWVTFHSLTSLEDFLMWELDTLQYDAITVCFPSGDPTSPNPLVSLKPNSIRHLIMLRKYIHHLIQDSHISVSSDASDHALEPDNFIHTTFHQYMSWKLNEITTSSPSPPPSVTAADPRAPPSTPFFSTQLLNFKRGIKRDISAYPTLKDEKYYESFKRSVLVTA